MVREHFLCIDQSVPPFKYRMAFRVDGKAHGLHFQWMMREKSGFSHNWKPQLCVIEHT